jgi:phage tail sheath protein FI
MKKLFISLMSIIVLLGCNLFSSSTSTDYVSAEYTSTQDIAQPGQETKVELEDGAAIVIPANAVESEVSVKVERNPEKANNLPPLDDGKSW